MYSLNKAMLIGNVTRDPEVRTTPNGKSVCSLSIATNYSWTDQAGQKQDRAEFHNIVAWGKLAEICQQYVKKGMRIYIEGRIQTRDWEDQQGIKRYRTEVIADNLIMLDRKQGTGGSTAEAPQSAVQAPMPTQAPEEEVRLEDVPF